ncbi:MAG: acetate--CoA ligase [Patescibacteria group bacterium]|nr:acetate--CoA ligase [Patescibacteria group bacterium]
MSKDSNTDEATEALLKEEKLYKPSEEVKKLANVKDYEAVVKKASEDYEGFWAEAAQELDWYKEWDEVLDESKKPFYKWFKGGQINIFHNALERHQKDKKDKVAYFWENQDGDSRKITYGQLYDEVNKFAGILKKQGVARGDRVAVYMPNIPETAVAMLACAKLGAMHTVVYAGFSAQALRERIHDAEAKVLVTVDGGKRRKKDIPLKETVDQALEKDCQCLKSVIVVKYTGLEINIKEGRDIWYHEIMKEEVEIPETEKMKATDPLFILYTSGTTSKPKGVIHVHGGYQVGISRTLKWVFDIKDKDVYWCSADPGWITGHSYIVYAPLILGATSVMYDGAPDHPEPDRLWQVIEKYKVSIFYTAPTLVRLMMKYGKEWTEKYKMESLRLLGSVGEPINPEAWRWYYENIGKGRCPIMDTWWQTETGAFMITPLPVLPLKAGSATKPFPGLQMEIVDKDGDPVPEGKGGFLVIKNPWPSMLTTLFNNPERYKKTYWQKIPDVYTTGDLATKDKDGYFWIQGRSDDVLKIAGHRIGNAEIESALVAHKAVVEAGVIGVPDELRGEVAKAFVIMKEGVEKTDQLKDDLIKKVREVLGPVVVFKEIEYTDKLPKTRSGKIMRRVLRAKELGEDLGDTSTLQE